MKKELAIQTINQLPNEDVSINDIIEALYIRIKIENGNTITHEELKKKIKKALYE